MGHPYTFMIIGEDRDRVDTIAGTVQSPEFSITTTITSGLEAIDVQAEYDGYLVCLPDSFQARQEDRRGSLIPPHANVSFIKQGAHDAIRLWGYQQGASDVMGWPASAEELRQRLAATVYADADRFHRSLSETVMLDFLKTLLEKGVQQLSPTLDTSLSNGFYYPEAVSTLGHTPLHSVALEQMATHGVLTRRLVNRIRSCDTCGATQLNYREVCGKCQSIDVAKVDTLHHFSCGHVAAIDEYRKGTGLECPKCATPMRHIGLDYEKLATHVKCYACDHLAPDAHIDTQCMRCTAVTAPHHTQERPIYEYTLTDMASIAVEEGRLGGLKLDTVLRGGNLGLYTAQYFEHELLREITRSIRYKSPYCVALIRIENLDVVRQQHMEKAHDYINQVFTALSQNLRTLDTTCVWGADTLAVLLSSTPLEGGQLVAQKMNQNVSALEHLAMIQAPSITVSLVSDTDGYASTEEIFTAATAELNT